MFYRILYVGAAIVLSVSVAPCQQTQNEQPVQPESKHIFWVIPNFRTAPIPTDYAPLTAGEKFKVASEDSFDRGTVALAGVFGGLSQLSNDNRSFGQGGAGFGRYFGAAYGDLVIGDYMTEAFFPVLFHQDPRYFRRGTGKGWSRLRYAMGQTFWTHSDSGRMQLNYSEIVGNSVASAVSTAYYTDNRTAGSAASKLGMQIGVDMAANVLKEFWPDIERKLRHKHRENINAFK
jgi:hypothetical protein